MAKNITPEKLFRLYKSQVKFLEQYYSDFAGKKVIINLTTMSVSMCLHNADEAIVCLSSSQLQESLFKLEGMEYSMFYTLLMHEVGHAIYSAPFNIAEENKFGADRFGIFNVLEDMRVEYQIAQWNTMQKFDVLRYVAFDMVLEEHFNIEPTAIACALLRTVNNNPYAKILRRVAPDEVEKILSLGEAYKKRKVSFRDLLNNPLEANEQYKEIHNIAVYVQELILRICEKFAERARKQQKQHKGQSEEKPLKVFDPNSPKQKPEESEEETEEETPEDTAEKTEEDLEDGENTGEENEEETEGENTGEETEEETEGENETSDAETGEDLEDDKGENEASDADTTGDNDETTDENDDENDDADTTGGAVFTGGDGETDAENDVDTEMSSKINSIQCEINQMKNSEEDLDLEKVIETIENPEPISPKYERYKITAFDVKRRSSLKGRKASQRHSGNQQELIMQRYMRRKHVNGEKLFESERFSDMERGGKSFRAVFYLDGSGSMFWRFGDSTSIRIATNYLRSFYDAMHKYMDIEFYIFGSTTYKISYNELSPSFISSIPDFCDYTRPQLIELPPDVEMIIVTDGMWAVEIPQVYKDHAHFVIIGSDMVRYFKHLGVKNIYPVVHGDIAMQLELATRGIAERIKDKI